ncbi:MAG: hypothetical protein Q8L99_04840 [Polycyclovorans sp.]|nr:hypothetical protein [Polycyclovorans sp.]
MAIEGALAAAGLGAARAGVTGVAGVWALVFVLIFVALGGVSVVVGVVEAAAAGFSVWVGVAAGRALVSDLAACSDPFLTTFFSAPSSPEPDVLRVVAMEITLFETPV